MTTLPRPDRLAPPLLPGLRVRVATEADIEAVVALRLQLLAEEARSSLFARPRHDVEEQARALTLTQLASRTDVILLAMHDHVPVGLLRCAVSHATRLVRPVRYGFVTSAFVEPAHRRRGVLRALVLEAEAWCRLRGLREVRLHCTVENADGNASWEALGYEVAEVVRRRPLTEE
ncbi:MAG: GNAT family N-acetyltransferase [Gemmatimonadota bacterium]